MLIQLSSYSQVHGLLKSCKSKVHKQCLYLQFLLVRYSRYWWLVKTRKVLCPWSNDNLQSTFLTLALHPLPVSWQLHFQLSKLYFAMDFYRVASYIHVSSKSSLSYVIVLYVNKVTQIKKVKKEMMVMGSHLACINKNN